MLGIGWGIVAVAVLMAYGSGFRVVMMRGFDAFGKAAVVAWPGQTSEQAGGERAGRVVRIEKVDRDNIRLEATMVKSLSLESTRWFPVTYGSEFEVKALFFYKRRIGICLANSGFQRSRVAARVTFDMPLQVEKVLRLMEVSLPWCTVPY
jgi:hypothetical protein